MKAKRKSRWYNLLPFAVFFVTGVIFLVEACYADAHHTKIWHGPNGARRDPWQGYLAAALCFIATGVAVASELRKTTDDDI
jgi:hypothetical protein